MLLPTPHPSIFAESHSAQQWQANGHWIGSRRRLNPKFVSTIWHVSASAGLIPEASVGTNETNRPALVGLGARPGRCARSDRPMAAASFTGTLLPIIWILSAGLPSNSNQSGKLWIRAASRIVSGRVSRGWRKSRIALPVIALLGSSPLRRRMPAGGPPRFSRGVPSITRRRARRLYESCQRRSGRSRIVWPDAINFARSKPSPASGRNQWSGTGPGGSSEASGRSAIASSKVAAAGRPSPAR